MHRISEMVGRKLASGVALPLVLAILLSVMPPGEAVAPPAPAPDALPYSFDRPESVVDLPRELDEVSGLTIGRGGALYAVQDEKGIVFELDKHSGDVIQRIQFGKKGDYEGIAYMDGHVFVLRSDGALFHVGMDDPGEVVTYDSALHSSCDAEGLAAQAARGRLLIACKEEAGEGLQHHRAMYAFDLTTKKFVEEPAYVIDLQTLRSATDDGLLRRILRAALDPVVDVERFRPSAIDIHPMTGEIYVVSSSAQSILVLDAQGKPRELEVLSKKLFEQPEGLAFLPDGGLLISSERGQRKRATLMQFTQQLAHAN